MLNVSLRPDPDRKHVTLLYLEEMPVALFNNQIPGSPLNFTQAVTPEAAEEARQFVEAERGESPSSVNVPPSDAEMAALLEADGDE